MNLKLNKNIESVNIVGNLIHGFAMLFVVLNQFLVQYKLYFAVIVVLIIHKGIIVSHGCNRTVKILFCALITFCYYVISYTELNIFIQLLILSKMVYLLQNYASRVKTLEHFKFITWLLCPLLCCISVYFHLLILRAIAFSVLFKLIT